MDWQPELKARKYQKSSQEKKKSGKREGKKKGL